MKKIKSKLKLAIPTKLNTFNFFDTHWIALDFVTNDKFTHRKLRNFYLDELPFFVNDTCEFYTMWFKEDGIRIMFNRVTDEVFVCGGDYALYAGYENLDDMIMDGNVLDACNIIKKLTGKFPIQKIKVESIF